ncbi:MAG: CRTAC1 family protein, partial [Planctomycetes bacterium]|nr:CRTAC1 family protein [Planctomycetota bacterium]
HSFPTQLYSELLPDIYVPCFGKNHLFHNLGGGKFVDVTAKAGVAGAESEWSTAGAMGDIDGDGDLDLYVCNYADMRRYMVEARGPRDCKWREMPVACGPLPLEAQRDRLFVNRGDGTFTDATDERMAIIRRYSFQAVMLDFDRDGAIDIYVACDAQPNLLFRNDGKGRFTEVGIESGVAVSASGIEQASMGVAAGDVDDDGKLDLFVTNFSHESNCLYRNVGVPTTLFGDSTAAAGLDAPSQMTLGWGASFSDLDNDGDVDLVYANGHLYPGVEKNVPETTYAQHIGVFRNDGKGRFQEISADTGEALRPRVHRGVIAADFDDDGATDLFATVLNDRAVLLRNDGRGVGKSVRFILRRRGGTVEGAGSRLTADVDGVPGRKQIVRDLALGSSFGSSEDPRLAVGLGSAGRITGVRVRWPGAGDDSVLPPEGSRGFEPGAVYTVVEGQARAVRTK